MDQRIMRRGVLVASLAAAVIGGFALTGSVSGQQVGSGDIVADRQRLMALNGASAKDLNDKAKAGNIEAIAVNAETLALNARHIPALFPKGSMTDKSYAKAEIWDKWAEFEAAAKNLEEKAIALRDAAKKNDTAAVQGMLPNFGREACGTCHTPFRRPKN